MKKRIAILGSTGSIGKTSLNIFKNNPKKFEIKDNTNLRTRKLFNKSLFEELRKKHKV